MADDTTRLTNEALDWNGEATAESSQFTLLEPGTYTYRVTDFKRANFDGSDKMQPCPMADITIACANAAGAQADVQFKLFLNRKMQWKMTQFFKSCHLLAADLPDGTGYAMGPLWKQVLGAVGQVEISNRRYDGKDYNDVKAFVVPEPGASRYGEGF